ncbi:MAG TPA: bifunctional precorrin-2 dehydrogenase/sirohydrochlorin ferrochelatase [Acidimicrobiales bacterium]
MTPALYPVGLVVDGRPCLVVGGGPVAARKAAGLVACGAVVTVVAPAVVPAVEALGVAVERRAYRRGEAAGYRLVVTATGDPEVDQAVFDDAEAAGVWANSADDPGRCSFTLPAVARRGPVTVAVATDGTAPALAAWLRDRLAAALPADVEALAAALAAARAELRAAVGTSEGLDWPALIDRLAGVARAEGGPRTAEAGPAPIGGLTGAARAEAGAAPAGGLAGVARAEADPALVDGLAGAAGGGAAPEPGGGLAGVS